MNPKNDPSQCMTITTRSGEVVGDEEPKNVVEDNVIGKASIVVDDDAIEDGNDGMQYVKDLTLGNLGSD